MIGTRGKFWQAIAEIRNPKCELCPLHKSTINRCIMGRGSAYAPIMLCGEAPGEAEAKSGKPFMGAAGIVLNNLLNENDMAHLCYITNIAKCRPSDNRKPTTKEADTCTSNYLDHEIELIKPKIIVLLGKTATENFLPDKKTERGNIYPWYPYYVIPTYHPAYYLHSNSIVALEQMRQHLLKAKGIAAQ